MSLVERTSFFGDSEQIPACNYQLSKSKVHEIKFGDI